MLPNKRRDKILELIKEDGQAKVLDLSRIFMVSEVKVTIRQDLEKLEKKGVIIHEHGGAYLKNIDLNVQKLSLQNHTNMSEKIAVARKAVEFIQERDTIILDSGSTTTEIANLMEIQLKIYRGKELAVPVAVGVRKRAEARQLSQAKTNQFAGYQNDVFAHLAQSPVFGLLALHLLV
jgi:hypothetical protein